MNRAEQPAKLPIRNAATVVVLRDTDRGPEAFMLRRAQGAVFLGGAYVFPGGALDAGDADPRWSERIAGLTAADADRRLAVESGGLAYWIAALRECFEEAGILFMRQANGEPLHTQALDTMFAHRAALCRGETDWLDLVTRTDAVLMAGELVYFDHWITPPLRPRRFDTRFFIARAPIDQEGSHDNSETVHSLWIRAAEALARGERKDIELAPATRTTLTWLTRFASVDEALAASRSRTHIEVNRPAIAQGSDGPKIFRLGDAGYYEIHWSDPAESTQTSYDLISGVAKRLDEWTTRVIAPNPGMMTGPGTNTYLVGRRSLAVIDPGPDIDAHVEAIVSAAADRPIRWILCTHTHRDHSPAASALRERTGATVIGLPAPPGATQDQDFEPEHVPVDGDIVDLEGAHLRALHTPGHASNHVCWLLENTGMLFTGDHVMQGSTVVINPPDGDMAAYLESLMRVRDLAPAIIAPGHGYLVGAVQREIDKLIEHRRWREARVVDALVQSGGGTLDALVPLVYADVPQNRHALAARSLLAHLLKLEREGRIVRHADAYRLA